MFRLQKLDIYEICGSQSLSHLSIDKKSNRVPEKSFVTGWKKLGSCGAVSVCSSFEFVSFNGISLKFDES
jgi:hypothetical protein